MHSGFDLIRVVSLGCIAILLFAAIARAAAKGIATQARIARLARARADILRWADRNGYTILHREVVFFDDSYRQVVHRLVVRDQLNRVGQALVRCGSPLHVQWEDRIAFASPLPSRTHPLWDADLDA
jgi:hypothetical protein